MWKKYNSKNVDAFVKTRQWEILLEGTEIQHLKGKALKKLYTEIQMVFQIPQDSFDPRRTLGDSIMESMRNHNVSRKEAQNRLWQLLQQVELPSELADRYPNQSAADSVSAQQLPEHWQLIRKS